MKQRVTYQWENQIIATLIVDGIEKNRRLWAMGLYKWHGSEYMWFFSVSAQQVCR